jgi:hypothetical protein
MNYVLIGMKQLFELDTNEEKIDMIQTHIKSVLQSPSIDGYINYFPFDDDYIVS